MQAFHGHNANTVSLCIQLTTSFCILYILGSSVLTPNAVYKFTIRHAVQLSMCFPGLTRRMTTHSCTAAAASAASTHAKPFTSFLPLLVLSDN